MTTEGDQNAPVAEGGTGRGRILSSPLPRRLPDSTRRPVLPAQRPAPPALRDPTPTDPAGLTRPAGGNVPPAPRGAAARGAPDRGATDRVPPRAPGEDIWQRPSPDRSTSIPVFGPVDPAARSARSGLPLAAPAAPGPAADAPSARRAGPSQGLLLLAGSSVPVLGGVLAAPLLPTIGQEFAAVPGVAALVPLIIGVHGLSVALMAPFAGALLDRFGRTRLLVAALVVVALAGTAPAYLPNLPLILASRMVLGAAVAFVVVSCTTLIGDYFPGEQRDRWLGWQVVATSMSATVFFVVGGALGESGWRTPFWVFLIALVLVPLVARLLPDPVRATPPAPADGGRRRVPWKVLALPWGLTLVTSTLFYVVPTQLSYVLVEQGVTTTSTIGIITAAAALSTGIGGFLVGNLAADRLWLLLPIESALTAAGLLMLGLAGDSLVFAANGAMLASVGGGMLVATLLIWTMRVLDGAGIRGLGTGAWTCAFFLGQFVGPVVATAVAAGQVGGLQRAITGMGVVGVVLVVGTIVLGLVSARRAAEPRRA